MLMDLINSFDNLFYDIQSFFKCNWAFAWFIFLINIQSNFWLINSINHDHTISLLLLTSLYGIFALLYFSRAIEALLIFADGGRLTYTSKEFKRLLPLWKEAEKTAHLENKIRLVIVDTMTINAYSLPHFIIITRGLVASFDDEEITAVMLHEFGHIINGDVKIKFCFSFFLNIYYNILMLVYMLLRNLVQAITIEVGYYIGLFIETLLLFMGIIPKLILNVFLLVTASGNRYSEYKADRFVANCGERYRVALISSLYILYDMQISDKRGLINRLIADHPKPACRIAELEQR